MPSGPGPTRAFVVSHTLSCSTLWASSFLFMKLSAAMGPLALASCRGVVAALAIGTWFALQGQSVLPRAGEWRHWLVLGTFNGWGPNVLVAYALTQIATGTAAMIQAASPLIVAVIAHLMFAEERLSPTRLVGVFVGFVGMALLIGPAALPDSGVSLAGVLAMTAVSLSYAVGSIYARTARETAPARLGFGQQVCSGAVATILTLAVAGPAAYEPMSRTALPLVALGVLATDRPVHAPDPLRGADQSLDGWLPDAGLDHDPRNPLPRRDGRPARASGRRRRARRRGHGEPDRTPQKLSLSRARRMRSGISTGRCVVRST
jgi:drug/metabolite transporter (DMT)-like permease